MLASADEIASEYGISRAMAKWLVNKWNVLDSDELVSRRLSDDELLPIAAKIASNVADLRRIGLFEWSAAHEAANPRFGIGFYRDLAEAGSKRASIVLQMIDDGAELDIG